MRRIARLFRRSIFLKIFAVSALTSIALIYLAGSQLYGRIRDGIFEEKITSSLTEGRAAIQYIEYRFTIASFDPKSDFSKLTKELVNSSNVSAAESGREVALFSISREKVDGIPAKVSSNFLKFNSVPKSLRKDVRESGELLSTRGSLEYLNGRVIPGIFIGRTIEIPQHGFYEVYVGYDFVAQQRNVDLIGRSMWGTGLLLLALILITASVVLRIVIRPVQVAADVAESLTAGNLRRRIDVKGEDEVARLGMAFNQMANNLSDQITRLGNLSRVQQRFVSDVSHELRTPLTTIRMAADVIHGARESFDPTIARSSELLVSQIERFERLLEDLLEVSRFDAEAATLAISKVELTALVRRCIEDLNLGGAKTPEVKLLSRNQDLTIDADPRRISRVIRNLLNNAVDHCEGKPIEITVAENSSCVAIGVRDYGVGISEPNWGRVFDRFWRADPSRSRISGGTGLGLSIAREDASLHGGEIKVWGKPGIGSNFVLTLPKVPGSLIDSYPLSEIPTDLQV